ncbi:MAG: amino acid permease [Pirellulales bacterium]
MISRLFAVKLPTENEEGHTRLNRVLGPLELTMFGIGAIIGTGIFVLTGSAAAGGPNHVGAGPALIISFLILAVACAFAALCYAEFASMIPVSGSAYTYAYATFGELVAWIIGWDLILEYAVGNVAIAIGWSGYFNNLLEFAGIHLPKWLLIDPMTMHYVLKESDLILAESDKAHYSLAQLELAQGALASAPNIGIPIVFNLPAMLIVLCVTALLYIGIKESARLNTILVFIKFGMIALFLIAGLPHVDFATNWVPFAPNGPKGIMAGASLIFFAYVGFDAVSTTAEEARNPQRDLPIGMLTSLVVCTVLYIMVATVLTSMVPLNVLRNEEPVAAALKHVGAHTAANIISLGAVLSITSVLVVMQLGQTRIFYAMSRDGLLPGVLSKVHPRFQTPHVCTLITGLLVVIPAGLVDIGIAAEISNIGTLFAFILVAGGIIILRIREPNRTRKFKTPLVWLVAPGCIITCFVLMLFLPPPTWWRFGLWMAVGLVFYFSYGYHRSRLGKAAEGAAA